MHVGVPAWQKQGEGGAEELVFGDIADTPFKDTFNFFTNDPSKDEMSTYDWPFYYDKNVADNARNPMFNGVLSGVWSGCESVCATLSKLLKDGIFCSYPWNIGLGYAFRDKSIPKLVFVFTNEFDNQFTT